MQRFYRVMNGSVICGTYSFIICRTYSFMIVYVFMNLLLFSRRLGVSSH